jgi:hypothetical protein
LLDDLWDLYERTKGADLKRKDGKKYVPSRFRQQLERCRNGEADPVELTKRICRRQTEGFDVILESLRSDLTVEALVLDSQKPYHDLFVGPTREACAARMAKFKPDE